MDPTPGKFHEGDTGEVLNPDDITPEMLERIRSKEQAEISLQISPELVAELSAFREGFSPDTDLVYYPCCGQDASPSEVFHDRVVYLDSNPDCVDAFKKAGHEAYHGDANVFNPGEVDVTLVYNPQMAPEPFFVHIKEGGYLVCNNYHGTADFMRRAKGFNFVGAIDQNGKVDKESLDDFWKEVETDEALRSANPFIAKHFAKIVHTITGRTDDILARYREIARSSFHGTVQHEGRTIALFGIPKKKTATSYVFQKRSLERQR